MKDSINSGKAGIVFASFTDTVPFVMESFGDDLVLREINDHEFFFFGLGYRHI